MTEVMAARIFLAAINEGRALELLMCLFEGGSATVNPEGRLVLASAAVIAGIADMTADHSRTDDE